MWALLRRSGRVNAPQLIGAMVAITAAIGILAAAAAWLAAGLTDPALATTGGQLVTLSSSFIGVAALIAGLTVSTTIATGLRERRRQYALLSAVGATAGRLRSLILFETLLLFVPAAPLGALLGFALAAATIPLLQNTDLAPDGYALPIDATPAATATGVMLLVAVAGAWSASRHALRVQAAEAVRSSGVESSRLGTGRRIAALVVVLAGGISATMPLVLPGMVGVAFAAVSTFLLVTALALVGPTIAAATASRIRRTLPPNSSLELPLANVRGFSRRLTAVLVPFALVAALGAVQLSTDAIVDTAAREQLAGGLVSDLAGVVSSAQDAEAVRRLEGTDEVVVLGSVAGEVLVDQDDDLPFEIWEPATLATISGTEGITGVLDPGVTAGSLADLRGDNTIAVSADALLGSTSTIGDSVAVRTDGTVSDRTIVAVYTSSLGFGDYLVTRPDDSASGTLLVSTTPDRSTSVRTEAAALGIELQDSDGYAARLPDSGESSTSSVLLFALLAFGLLAAVNTLVSLIRGRRDEFDLLTRIGATRTILIRTIVIETLIAAILAIVLGLAAALPAAFGAGIALLHGWPPLPWATILTLPVVLLGCATATATITSIWLSRKLAVASSR